MQPVQQKALFLGKYRVSSHRRLGWDYSDQAWYFVTMCTHNREPLFGEIRNNIMGLNKLGCIVVDEIQQTNLIRRDVTINNWIVMPDHVHLIIGIEWNDCIGLVETERRSVSTIVGQIIPLSRRKPGSVGSIIQNIKSQSTKRIRQNHNTKFQWQPNYHDRVIRNEREHQRFREYIRQNPRRH